MADAPGIFVGKGKNRLQLLLPLANRHGLIAGATGTGKTATLRVLAEGFSAAGVPVFVADVKGDIAGMSKPGEANPKIAERAKKLGVAEFTYRGLPRSSGIFTGRTAIRSAPPSRTWGRCCCRGCWSSTRPRPASCRSPSSSPTTTVCCCSTSRTCAHCSRIWAENAAELKTALRQRHRRLRRRGAARPAGDRGAGRRQVLRRAGSRPCRHHAQGRRSATA